MPLVPGLIALALLGADGPPRPEAGAIAAQFRLLEMDGLAWREALHGKLRVVSQQGSATIWTADREVVAPLIGSAEKHLDAPRVTSEPEAPATLSSRTVRSYVSQVSRVADGPDDGDSTSNLHPEIRPLTEGFQARIAGRVLDQGILTRVAIENLWCIALHNVTCAEEGQPEGEDPARGGDRTAVKSRYQVPEVAGARVAGEWLVPTDGVLIIGFGARTVPGESGRADVRERLVLIELAPVTEPEDPGAPATTTEEGTTRVSSLPSPPCVVDRTATAGPAPYVIAPTGGAVALVSPVHVPMVCWFDGIGPDGVRTRVFGVEPPPLPPAPYDPVAARVVHVPAPVPVAPVPGTSYVIPTGAVMDPSAAVPPPPAPAAPPLQAAPGAQGQRYPEVPSRTFPPAFDPHGQPYTLPPLPDATAAALAADERESGTAEPRPSPQFPARRPPTPTDLAGATLASRGLADGVTTPAAAGSGTVELKGRVVIHTQDGLTIEADSIVLRPPTSPQATAPADPAIRPTSALVPARIPAFASEFVGDVPDCEPCPLAENCPETCEPCPLAGADPMPCEVESTMDQPEEADGEYPELHVDEPVTTRLNTYRIPVGRGAVELKFRVSRVRRSLTAE